MKIIGEMSISEMLANADAIVMSRAEYNELAANSVSCKGLTGELEDIMTCIDSVQNYLNRYARDFASALKADAATLEEINKRLFAIISNKAEGKDE